MSPLFDTVKVGALTLRNRIVMSPLTRARASADRVPNDLMAEYYSQRADVGLIISEATVVSSIGAGYANTPGIWNDEQVQGWKKTTDAVHEKGGLIFLQLWHVGRISSSVFHDGALPVAPSAVRPKGTVSILRPQREFETPRALTTEEVRGTVQDFRRAAENSKLAGFDGVEIHGANGYLLDQFLQSSTNQRTDEYGGSIENRARLCLEITDACIDVWGANRVGYHMSPQMDIHDVGDDTPEETFGYLARELGKRKLAFLFLRDPKQKTTAALKKEFGGIVVANQGLDKNTAVDLINNGEADLVAWGQLAIANPDLTSRLQKDAELNKPDYGTFYQGGASGYTDYPRL